VRQAPSLVSVIRQQIAETVSECPSATRHARIVDLVFGELVYGYPLVTRELIRKEFEAGLAPQKV